MWSEVDAIREAAIGPVQTRPKASFTIREYANRYGLSESFSRNTLSRLAQKGEVKKIRCYVIDSMGRRIVTNVYCPNTK